MQFKGSLIPCRLCGSPPEEHVVYATRDRHMRSLRTVRCPRCNLVFSNPMPTDEELDEFYKAEYRTLYKGAVGPQPKRILRATRVALSRARLLSTLVRPGAKVLDIGAGGGETVYALTRLGYDAQGIEPGADYAEFARSAYGIRIHIGPFLTFAGEEGTFDAVISFHVMEHLPDPDVFFGFVKSQLKKGGVLLVEVPNIASRRGSFSGRFHMAHVHHFSSATMQAFAEKSGFSLLGNHAGPEDGIVVMSFVNGPAAGKPPKKTLPAPDAAAAAKAVQRLGRERRVLGGGWLATRMSLLRRTLNERRFVRSVAREDIARIVVDRHLAAMRNRKQDQG